jgi:hypothetical protein
MKVTDEVRRIYDEAYGTREDQLQAVLDYLEAKGALVEVFDPETWDGETEPPIGWRVCDSDGDVWLHGTRGWGAKGGSEWYGSDTWSDITWEMKTVLVPGGFVPEEDR